MSNIDSTHKKSKLVQEKTKKEKRVEVKKELQRD
jgi:hypothetical protein